MVVHFFVLWPLLLCRRVCRWRRVVQDYVADKRERVLIKVDDPDHIEFTQGIYGVWKVRAMQPQLRLRKI